MAWRLIALFFFLVGIAVMPLWPYSQNWSVFAPAFCWFVTVLFLLISFFARRGSAVWKHPGQG